MEIFTTLGTKLASARGSKHFVEVQKISSTFFYFSPELYSLFLTLIPQHTEPISILAACLQSSIETASLRKSSS